jgi:hypothetical protein
LCHTYFPATFKSGWRESITWSVYQ